MAVDYMGEGGLGWVCVTLTAPPIKTESVCRHANTDDNKKVCVCVLISPPSSEPSLKAKLIL